ncbi:MAG: anti-sigma regulatory factor [Chloroflexota bacterium]|nr:MAG: anti-sigma regulatory factor [Chloroflexota bacterium]
MTSAKRRVAIVQETDVTRALLEARMAAKSLGFNEVDIQMIATAVSELARNIIKYADRGEIIIDQIENGFRVAIEVIARDRGPGIADIEQAVTDNYSSSGTLGLGLPGVKRMMDDFEIRSTEGEGTTVQIKKWRR